MRYLAKRPFMWMGAAIITAIFLVDWFQIKIYPWLILNVLMMLTWILVDKRSHPENITERSYTPLIILSTLIIFLAGWRYISVQPESSPNYINWYNDTGEKVTLSGWIQAPPDERDAFTNLRIRATNITSNNQDREVEGLVLVRVPPNKKYIVGDDLLIRGYLFTPNDTEDFSYKEYLARQGIHSFMSPSKVTNLPSHSGSSILRITNQVREKLLSTIKALFPEPESSLLAGILLGVDKGISPATQDAFRNTGTTHIIAISGFNIAILAGLFSYIFKRWLGRWKGAVAAVLGIAFYTILVGADASVVRAAIMGGTALFSTQIGRRQDGLNTLGFVAGVMCLMNPLLPWDVGFQLSFAATLGLILYAQPLQEIAVRWLSKKFNQERAQKLAAPISEYILFTFAAQVTTIPLIAFHFKQISLTSFLVNPLILPAQPPVMIVSGLAALLGTIYLPLGKVIAWLAWPFSMYTIRVVEIFDKIPDALIYLGEFSFLVVLLSYFVLFFVTLAPVGIKDKVGSQLKPAAMLSVMALVVLLVWRTALSLPDGKLHITFLDVDNGDAILIKAPSGDNILINGGPSRSVLADALGRRLSPFDRHLDALVIGSTKENQLTSLPGVVQQFPPSQVLWSGRVNASYSAMRLNSQLTSSNVEIIRAESGMVLDLGEGCKLEVLSENNNGMILLLSWGDFIALLPLEMDFEELDNLKKIPILANTSVYLLPESGYSPLNPPDWINKLSPNLIILSVSASNPDGLPDLDTLSALDLFPYLRTDQSGWIKVTTDGQRMWVEVEH